MKSFKTAFFLAVTMFTLAGCASKPTIADAMRGHADAVQQEVDMKNEFAKTWEQGSKLTISGQERIERGEKLVKSAEKDLSEGNEEIKLGNQEITEGKKLMLESEQEFRKNYPDLRLKPQ